MAKKLQESLYYFLSNYPIFYPILFFILQKKGFLNPKMHRILSHYGKKNDFFFVQIGANDGRKADPLFLYAKKFGWRGLLVEPVKYLFEKLKINYQGRPGIILENCAISEKDGFKEFYSIRPSNNKNLPLWYDEIGSFMKETILKSKEKIPNIEELIVSEKIRCLSLKSLLAKYNIHSIDLLNIDTEGYDYYIIKQLPLLSIKPKIIIFEDRHLSIEQSNFCKKLLIKQGYGLIQLSGDCIAVLR